MSLKDLNWKKFVGKEAFQQGMWSVQTSSGQRHRVSAGISTALASQVLEIHVDDTPHSRTRVWVNVGRLTKFELGGDVFELRQAGYGILGKLVLIQNGRDIPALEAQDGETQPPRPDASDIWQTRIEEAERVSEPLGTEERIIDNSRSSSSIERTIVVSRQWTQSVSFEKENVTGLEGGVNVKLPLSAGLEASATSTVKRAYAVAEEATRTYSEEVKINVAKNTQTRLLFHWRQVWQRGVIVGKSVDGAEVRIPFEVKLHPTFDQSQEDLDA